MACTKRECLDLLKHVKKPMPDISISAGNSGISAGNACDWFLFLQAIYCDMHVPLRNRFWISSPSFFKVTFSFPKGIQRVSRGRFIRMIRKFPLENMGKVPFLLTQLCLLLGVASCWKLTATAVFQAQQSVTMWQIIFLVRTTTTVTITTITQTWCLWQIFFWQIAFRSMIKANNIGYGIDHSFGLRSKGAAINWVCV